ncbi:MAG: hypothetical protein FJ253_08395 [Phycisphaerae bacterium]|nr:hypothetical protein [Phycisphaerae bacterium]
MTFVEAALDVHEFLKTLSPEQKRERRCEQWRRYGCSAKGRERTHRYAATPKGRAAKFLYEVTVRAARRAPRGVIAGTRRDGRHKFNHFDGCYAVTYARPEDRGITAPSPELVAFEQWMRPNEEKARDEYGALLRNERAAGLANATTLAELAR